MLIIDINKQHFSIVFMNVLHTTNLKRIILFLLITGIFSCKSYRVQRLNAFDQIDILKNNTLIVRLNTSDNKIFALKNNNRFDEADKETIRIIEENQKTIDAFKLHYNFSQVYFIQPSEGELLRQMEYKEVKLINTNGKILSDNLFLKKGYLIATFGRVYQEQFIYEDKNNRRHSLGGTTSVPALVILDSDYIQLKRPFPFRILTSSHESYKEDAVKALNIELESFYRKKESRRMRKNRK
jgi:hypothetical protein